MLGFYMRLRTLFLDLRLIHGRRFRGPLRDDRDRKCATENNSGRLRIAARIGSGAAAEANVAR